MTPSQWMEVIRARALLLLLCHRQPATVPNSSTSSYDTQLPIVTPDDPLTASHDLLDQHIRRPDSGPRPLPAGASDGPTSLFEQAQPAYPESIASYDTHFTVATDDPDLPCDLFGEQRIFLNYEASADPLWGYDALQPPSNADGGTLAEAAPQHAQMGCFGSLRSSPLPYVFDDEQLPRSRDTTLHKISRISDPTNVRARRPIQSHSPTCSAMPTTASAAFDTFSHNPVLHWAEDLYLPTMQWLADNAQHAPTTPATARRSTVASECPLLAGEQSMEQLAVEVDTQGCSSASGSAAWHHNSHHSDFGLISTSETSRSRSVAFTSPSNVLRSSAVSPRSRRRQVLKQRTIDKKAKQATMDSILADEECARQVVRSYAERGCTGVREKFPVQLSEVSSQQLAGYARMRHPELWAKAEAAFADQNPSLKGIDLDE